jgi:hypothetical protein|tara:strand:- start:161 stop:571 length:411 start_codon:yes stop_codon:yes gene_type:complete
MPTEIISGLWIGNVDCSFDNNFLKDNNISILINCTVNYGFPDINVKKLRIPLSNNLTPSEDLLLLKKNKGKIIDYIYENIDVSNILIYCYDGLLISPLIVSLFLIKKGEISKDNIRSILKSKNNKITLDVDLSEFS